MRAETMRTFRRYLRKTRRGSVLAIVIVIGLCLALLGWGMLQLGFGARLTEAKSVFQITAREAADAGIRHALYSMNKNFIFGQPWNDAMLPAHPFSGTVPNSSGSFSYNIVPLTANKVYEIISTGTSGGQTRVVHARTKMTNLFEYGLIVTKSLLTRNSTLVDGYDSRLGLYGSGNSGGLIKMGTTNIQSPPQGGITLYNGSTINGDVMIGVGGDLDVVIKDLGATTGPRYNMQEPFEFEVITPPNCGPSLGNLNTTNTTIGAPGAVTYARYNSITIQNSGVLEIVGEVYIHVTGTIDLKNSAEMRISANSSVKIYLENDLLAGQANGINNMSKIPANFVLFGVGTNPNQRWDIRNSGDFYGVYYAPNADITIYAKGEVFGSVAGQSFELKADPGSANGVHYDNALSQLYQYDTGFGINRWWEE
jgi:hypothetical protein